MFSILAAQFKNSEIKSLSDLFEKICESPVKPKPTCESLLWTWDWKNYVTEKLSDTELANHSFYNCFQIKKENNQTKLRAKPMPQDRSWYPESGIHLMKENSTFDEPVPVADFRIDKLELPRVYHDLLKYFKRMPTPHSMVLVIGYCQCVKKFTAYSLLHQSLKIRSHLKKYYMY